MNADKKARLEKAGWKVGTVQEFLGLSDEEMAIIDGGVAQQELAQVASNHQAEGSSPSTPAT